MTNVQSGQITLTATERVIFGQPAAEALAQEVKMLGAQRVLLITSETLRSKTDDIAKIESALGSDHAATFSGVPPHAPREAVIAATAKAREVDADLIVSVGGGSVTDCAKIVPIGLSNDITTVEQMGSYHITVDNAGQMVNPDFKPQTVRTICIPTTLSGGEFNPLSGATDSATKHKQAYEKRLMAPVSVILDPALTRHTPEWLWFSTGVRSLDHAIETLQSFRSNDYCDGLADSALRLLIEGLPRVKADPADMEARLKCQIGAWQSMLPIIGGVPMGASHAIGHVLGGLCDVPHGYTSCVMSPFVLKWNADVNADRQRRISAAFGEPEKPASELVHNFIAGLGMPRSLTAVEVTEDRFQNIAEYTMDDIWGRTNPKTISGPSDVMQILRLAS